jgi:hypothetical protein
MLLVVYDLGQKLMIEFIELNKRLARSIGTEVKFPGFKI